LQRPSKIILGIDPGTLLMGYGLIRITGDSIVMIEMGILKLSGKKDNHERLKHIHSKVQDLVRKHKPSQLAIEAPFFGKNVQSMLKLGRAQGVAIAAAMSEGIPVTEYSPRKVKQSITGNGNADKEQVWKMLQTVMCLSERNQRHYDASDALAVALCHHFQDKPIPKTNGKVRSWKEFIASNPGRVI
jgi:crossover junction endodeoxyribonuclease RuvC